MQVDVILVEVSSVGQEEREDLMEEEKNDAEEGVHGAHGAAAWMKENQHVLTQTDSIRNTTYFMLLL